MFSDHENADTYCRFGIINIGFVNNYTAVTWRRLRCGSKVITNDKVTEKRKLAINTPTYCQT